MFGGVQSEFGCILFLWTGGSGSEKERVVESQKKGHEGDFIIR